MPAYPRSLPPLLACCWLAGVGCGPDAAPRHDCDLSAPHVVVATTDFRVGALAAVTADGCVADGLSSTSGDAVVRATSERLWVLNRTGGDALLGYRHGAYHSPELELGAFRHDNPHDLVRVGDRLFVSLYDQPTLVVLQADDGSEVGRIDLSSYGDADGLPEADALVVRDGSVYLSMQRLDRNRDWMPAGEGAVVQIDPDAMEVTAEWWVDANPRMTTFGVDIVVMSGSYFEADGSLEVLHTDMEGGAAREPVLFESDLELDLGGGRDGVVLATALEIGGDSVVGCLSAGGFTRATASSSWFADATDAGDLGLGVVVAARQGWAGDGDAGLWSVETDGCVASPLESSTLLAPFSLAVVP